MAEVEVRWLHASSNADPPEWWVARDTVGRYIAGGITPEDALLAAAERGATVIPQHVKIDGPRRRPAKVGPDRIT